MITFIIVMWAVVDDWGDIDLHVLQKMVIIDAALLCVFHKWVF